MPCSHSSTTSLYLCYLRLTHSAIQVKPISRSILVLYITSARDFERRSIRAIDLMVRVCLICELSDMGRLVREIGLVIGRAGRLAVETYARSI